MKRAWTLFTTAGLGRYRLFATLLLPFFLVLTLMGGVWPTGTAHSAETPLSSPQSDNSARPLTIELQDINPETLTPGKDLKVTAKILNTSNAKVSDFHVQLLMQRQKLVNRTELENWEAGFVSGDVVADYDKTITLMPGESQTVALTVRADQLHLPPDAGQFGPRGIAVQAFQSTNDTPTFVGQTPSFVVWYPGKEFLPLKLTVLAPVTAPEADVKTGTVSAESLERNTSTGSRLDQLVDAVDNTNISLALDPLLLTSLGTYKESQNTGDQQSNKTNSQPIDSVESFSRKLTALKNPVVGLPYADPDIEAVAASGAANIQTLLTNQNSFDTPTSLKDSENRLLWPVDGELTEETAQTIHGAASQTPVIVSEHSINPSGLSFTAHSKTELALSDGSTHEVLVQDDQLSDIFDEATSSSESASGRQRFLAETAVITGEQPGISRNILITAPRNWDPNTTSVDSLSQAISGSEWIESTSIDQLLSSESVDASLQFNADQTETSQTETTSDSSAGATGTPLNSDTVNQVFANLTEATAFFQAIGQAQGDPTGKANTLLTEDRITASLVSAQWRNNPTSWQQAASERNENVNKTANSVSIVEGSSVNLVSDTSSIPVSVANAYSEPVTVSVTATPSNNRLTIKNSETVTIPPKSRERVHLPVKSVANGDVTLTLSILGPTGDAIGTSSEVTVRVRADWESWGTRVLAGVLVVLLVGGLIRTIRRGRRKVAVPSEEETHG